MCVNRPGRCAPKWLRSVGGVGLVTAVNFPARSDQAPDYLHIRDTPRSNYYRKEVAQSHHRRARLSGGGPLTNTHVYDLTEIEK
jgi:hypothetical protein